MVYQIQFSCIILFIIKLFYVFLGTNKNNLTIIISGFTVYGICNNSDYRSVSKGQSLALENNWLPNDKVVYVK